MKFISIGYGKSIAVERIVALVNPESAPIKRLMQDAKEMGRIIDVSCGRKTRSVIITDSEHVILSALTTEKISRRLEGEESSDDDDE
jgi:regulator of extracellular matrix RemA (YlzA/DUF370 family)